MKNCDYCGKENAESALACQGCGTDLRPATLDLEGLYVLAKVVFYSLLVGGLILCAMGYYIFDIPVAALALITGIVTCVNGFGRRGIRLHKNTIVIGRPARITGIVALIFGVAIACFLIWQYAFVRHIVTTR
jgi:hypothetical protein